MTGEDYTIEITNNGEVIELANQPFIENGEVYVPLREAIEKVDENAEVEWNNGSISITIIGNKYLLFIGEESVNINPVVGPTFSVDVYYPPILKGSASYMPFNTMVYLFAYDQDNNDSFDYIVHGKDGKAVDYTGFYHAILEEYSIKIPNYWAGKYTVRSTNGNATFIQTDTYDKYGEGSGTLFSIEKVSVGDVDELLNTMSGSRPLYRNGEYTYIFEVSTDVQY